MCFEAGRNNVILKRKRDEKDPHPMQHPTKSSCECKRQCLCLIPQERRGIIYSHYWSSLDRISQKGFILQCISNEEKKRTHTRKSLKKNRRHSRIYMFKRLNDEVVQVCSKFLLGMFGYKNDHVIS